MGKAKKIVGALVGTTLVLGAGVGSCYIARQNNPWFKEKTDNAIDTVVGLFDKNHKNSEESLSLDGISAISFDLVKNHQNEFWTNANQIFERDTNKNEAFSYTYTPTTLDVNRNNVVGFGYEVCASDRENPEFLSVFINVNDGKTAYKTVQKAVEEMGKADLTESAQKELSEQLSTNLKTIIENEANTITFNNENATTNYEKLAAQLLANAQNEVKEQCKISDEISKIELINLNYNNENCSYSAEAIYKTAVDANATVVENEDGTKTYTFGTEGTNKYQLTENDFVKDENGEIKTNENGHPIYFDHLKDKKGNVVLVNDTPYKQQVTEYENITYHNVKINAVVRATTKNGEIHYLTKSIEGVDVKCDNVAYASGNRTSEQIKQDIENTLKNNENPISGGTIKFEAVKIETPKAILPADKGIQYEVGKPDDPKFVNASEKDSGETAKEAAAKKATKTASSFDAETKKAIEQALNQYNNEHWNAQENNEENATTTSKNASRRK